jgi:hypothetical protein
MNQVALVGNLTDDPELRYTQSSAALESFTVAVSHRSKHNGEWQDVNDGFFRCTAWRSVADNAAQTLKKACGSSWPASSSSAAGRTTTATSASPSRSRSLTWALTYSSPLPRSPRPRQTIPRVCGGSRVIPPRHGTAPEPGSDALTRLGQDAGETWGSATKGL